MSAPATLHRTPHVKQSALDTLKELIPVVSDLIDLAIDTMAGAPEGGFSTDYVIEVLDAAEHELYGGLAQQVSGVRPGTPHFTADGFRAAHTFDDGSPVIERIELPDRSLGNFYPRRDGPRATWVDFMTAATRPALALVPEGGRRGDLDPVMTVPHSVATSTVITTAREILAEVATPIEDVDPTNPNRPARFNDAKLTAAGCVDWHDARAKQNLLLLAEHLQAGDIDLDQVAVQLDAVARTFAETIVRSVVI